jgi:hypothetical protein
MTREECLQKSEACRRKAEKAIDENFRAEWLRLAERWQRAAEDRKMPASATVNATIADQTLHHEAEEVDRLSSH